MHKKLSILLLLLVACAGKPASRPAGMPQPDIDARLANPIFFGSTNTSPATIDVLVTNRGQVPLVVRRVEIDSPGMGQYTIARIARHFSETVPAGQSKQVTVFATAVAQTTTRVSEPLTIRAIIELQAAGQMWREVAIIRASV